MRVWQMGSHSNWPPPFSGLCLDVLRRFAVLVVHSIEHNHRAFVPFVKRAQKLVFEPSGHSRASPFFIGDILLYAEPRHLPLSSRLEDLNTRLMEQL